MSLQEQPRDFNPYDTMLRIAQQSSLTAKQQCELAETIERMTRIISLQSTRIDSLEARLDLLETQDISRAFEQLVQNFTDKQ